MALSERARCGSSPGPTASGASKAISWWAPAPWAPLTSARAARWPSPVTEHGAREWPRRWLRPRHETQRYGRGVDLHAIEWRLDSAGQQAGPQQHRGKRLFIGCSDSCALTRRQYARHAGIRGQHRYRRGVGVHQIERRLDSATRQTGRHGCGRPGLSRRRRRAVG